MGRPEAPCIVETIGGARPRGLDLRRPPARPRLSVQALPPLDLLPHPRPIRRFLRAHGNPGQGELPGLLDRRGAHPLPPPGRTAGRACRTTSRARRGAASLPLPRLRPPGTAGTRFLDKLPSDPLAGSLALPNGIFHRSIIFFPAKSFHQRPERFQDLRLLLVLRHGGARHQVQTLPAQEDRPARVGCRPIELLAEALRPHESEAVAISEPDLIEARGSKGPAVERPEGDPAYEGNG